MKGGKRKKERRALALDLASADADRRNSSCTPTPNCAMLNMRLTVSFTTHGRPVRLPPPGHRESGSLFLLHFPFPSPPSEQISLDPLSSERISGLRRHRPPPADRADLAPPPPPADLDPPPADLGHSSSRGGARSAALGRRPPGGAAGPAAGGAAGPAAGGGTGGGRRDRRREAGGGTGGRKREARQGRRSPPAPAVGRREAQIHFFFAKIFQHFFLNSFFVFSNEYFFNDKKNFLNFFYSPNFFFEIFFPAAPFFA